MKRDDRTRRRTIRCKLPIHKRRKFSHVRGQISSYNSKTIRPTKKKMKSNDHEIRDFKSRQTHSQFHQFSYQNNNVISTSYLERECLACVFPTQFFTTNSISYRNRIAQDKRRKTNNNNEFSAVYFFHWSN